MTHPYKLSIHPIVTSSCLNFIAHHQIICSTRDLLATVKALNVILSFRTKNIMFHSFCTYCLGSVCPSPIPPTPGKPCAQLPGAMDCHYDGDREGTVTCCCDQCDTVTDMTCALNSTSGSGIWQSLPFCPADGCGTEGELKHVIS